MARVDLHRDVQTRAVTEAAIGCGSQIMHQKFMVKDGDADTASHAERGKEIETLIATIISGSTQRLRVASMVTSSQKILTALNSPQNAHNFMHDKLVVADDTPASGTFNLSLNATRNAENILVIEHSGLADLYADYNEDLAARYR